MKIILSILLCFLITTALGQTENTTTTDDTPTTEDTTTSDTTTVGTTPTTIESTTVVSTTISSSTSSSTTARSTTNAPTSTSSLAPSTTAPEPEPEKCEFNLTEGNNTCIRADIKAKFIINAEGSLHTIIPACNRTSVAGSCSNETQTLVVSESTYELTMLFEKKAGKVLVNNITFSYNLPGLPRGIGANNTEDLFGVKPGNSYQCKSKFDIYLQNITMEVNEVHIQAFIEGESFGTVEECDADEKVSDIVPIAVGVALALLIIIVLIAYLVGRRRSRQKGYQSV